MTGDTAAGNGASQAAFWKADCERYTVENLFGDGLGKLHDPDPHRPANCWVILRESRTVDSEFPAISVVGVYKDGHVARRICELITATAAPPPRMTTRVRRHLISRSNSAIWFSSGQQGVAATDSERRAQDIKVGDKVAYCERFIDLIGQEISKVRRARGKVTALISPYEGLIVAEVDWDYPYLPNRVELRNLIIGG